MSSKAGDLWAVSSILSVRRWDSSVCSAAIAQNNFRSTTVSLLESEIGTFDKAALWTDISMIW
ncbi:hypothetical protein T07_3003 [Trichinella nelsoni]|uniref:Uncharacterized protein n=1 Tax=Trichinella nelsoni TaxID=6336 RepID=A0A0V0SFM0_9BILA|nr:hypothetical protein T07_3003 [Trichinella nelsoni]